MSRHTPRSERWEQRGPAEYHSGAGMHVFFRKGAWWAEVAYRIRPEDTAPDALASPESHTDTLGPFKRPRNAMVEAERHATFLQRHHTDHLDWGH
jgi:hypothetical protein